MNQNAVLTNAASMIDMMYMLAQPFLKAIQSSAMPVIAPAGWNELPAGRCQINEKNVLNTRSTELKQAARRGGHVLSREGAVYCGFSPC